jgi:hypothetical protein
MNGSHRRTKRRGAFWGAAVALLLAAVAPGLRAQQSADSSSQQNPSDPQSAPPSPAEPATMNLVTGQALKSLITPWRWGRISLLSFDFDYGYDTNVLLDQNSSVSDRVYTARGLLIYSIQKPRSSLILQYAPSVFASDRVRQVNLLGQSLAFNSYRDLAQNWRLDFTDSFQYVPNQLRLNTPTFTQDFSTGTTTDQPFLATGRTYLTNTFTASLTHQLSATDNISVQSSYGVNNTPYANQGVSATPLPNLGQTLGFGLGWTHQWGATRQIGLTYQYARTFLGGPSNGSLFYTVLASYEQNLTPSLRVALSYGPSFGITQASFPSGLVTTNTESTYQGSFSLQKTFERSALSFHFARSLAFSGIVSDTLNNRYDASYLRQFGTRWNMSVGASYLEQAWATGGITRGRSSWVQWSYRLSPSLNAVVSYSYFDVRGTTQPFSGLMVTAGIRWAWGGENRPNGSTDNP